MSALVPTKAVASVKPHISAAPKCSTIFGHVRLAVHASDYDANNPGSLPDTLLAREVAVKEVDLPRGLDAELAGDVGGEDLVAGLHVGQRAVKQDVGD